MTRPITPQLAHEWSLEKKQAVMEELTRAPLGILPLFDDFSAPSEKKIALHFRGHPVGFLELSSLELKRAVEEYIKTSDIFLSMDLNQGEVDYFVRSDYKKKQNEVASSLHRRAPNRGFF